MCCNYWVPLGFIVLCCGDVFDDGYFNASCLSFLYLYFLLENCRKMGIISRKIFPACGNMCVCCPALRSRSRQPVKRYKKLLSEIFPKSPVSILFLISFYLISL